MGCLCSRLDFWVCLILVAIEFVRKGSCCECDDGDVFEGRGKDYSGLERGRPAEGLMLRLEI